MRGPRSSENPEKDVANSTQVRRVLLRLEGLFISSGVSHSKLIYIHPGL